MRHTQTFVELEISKEAFEEIRQKLAAAEYCHLFHCDSGVGPSKGQLRLSLDGIMLSSTEWEKEKGNA